MTLLYVSLLLIAVACCAFLLRQLWGAADLTPAQKRSMCAIIAALFLPASLGLYSVIGAPRIIEALDERSVTIARAEQKAAELALQTSKNPNQAELWVQLGLALLEAERTNDAVEALRKAVILSKGDGSIILLYAKAQIAASNGKVSDDARKALDMVLMQDPQNLEARYLTALSHIDRGEHVDAKAILDALLAELPEGIPFANKVRALRGGLR